MSLIESIIGYVAYVFIGVLVIELSLIVLVHGFKTNCKWILTSQDEFPQFDQTGLRKFIEKGFDPELGWARKPNTSGIERGREKDVEWHIDSLGSREIPGNFSRPPRICTIGDSYTFCRQVEDSETWQSYIATEYKEPVLNFGVGNYGVDQALLRYERTVLPETIEIVILAFVPETICRVQSYWKHYLEFGNVFAFKPRFDFMGGELKLFPNLIRSEVEFESYQDKLKLIQSRDRFYRSKFRNLQFRFPYLLSFFRAPIRHSSLFLRLILKVVSKRLHINSKVAENGPFYQVMRHNIRDAHRLYEDTNSIQLLDAIFERFKESARKRGQIPIVMPLPQMIDIQLGRQSAAPYLQFFKKLQSKVRVIDLSDELFRHPNLQELYIEDSFGGHFSPEGNRLIANRVMEQVKNLFHESELSGLSGKNKKGRNNEENVSTV